MKKTNRRQKRGTGGLRYKNGKVEGTFTIYRQNGTSIKKSFMRDTENEINDIKAQLRLLGLVDNDVKKIEIDKKTNKIKLIKTENKSNKTKIYSDMLVKDYTDYYLFTHRKKGVKGRVVEDTTFKTYMDRAKHIKDKLGNRKVAELTAEDIEEFVNNVHKQTCDTTARQVRDLITNMMIYAKKDGVTKENVLQDTKINLKESKGRREKKIIHKEDLQTFISYCKEHKYYDLLFILTTGIRTSELAGVTWNNIDFENGTVTLDKAYMRVKKQEYVNGKIVKTTTKEFKDLKTKDSYRTIGLQDFMLKLLRQHKEEQKELALKNNKKFTEKDWVFTTKKYNGYLADYSSDKFRKVVDTLKIKDYKELTTHSLRHTYCTFGIANGVRVEEMKDVLGHSNIAVTDGWYTHLEKEKVIEASKNVSKDMNKYF